MTGSRQEYRDTDGPAGATGWGGAESAGGVEVAPGVRMSEGLLRFSFARSSGPGGQNVNKVETKAELRVGVDDLPISGRARSRLRRIAGKRIVGGEEYQTEDGRVHIRGGELVIASDSERSQARNKSECLARLRELLVEALAEPKVRRKTRPTRGSVERRLDSKKRRGSVKRSRRDEHN